MKKAVSYAEAFLIGMINVLLGAGAGAIAVLMLKKQGMAQKQAQANALAVMLPTAFVSLIIYFLSGYVNFNDNIFIVPTAAAGALAGTLLLGLITPRLSRKLLGGFMIFAGIRMLMK